MKEDACHVRYPPAASAARRLRAGVLPRLAARPGLARRLGLARRRALGLAIFHDDRRGLCHAGRVPDRRRARPARARLADLVRPSVKRPVERGPRRDHGAPVARRPDAPRPPLRRRPRAAAGGAGLRGAATEGAARGGGGSGEGARRGLIRIVKKGGGYLYDGEQVYLTLALRAFSPFLFRNADA